MPTLPPPRGPEDPFNPYAAPTASIRGPVEEGFDYQSVNFGVSEVIGRAWSIYQSRMGFCIGVVVGFYAIVFAVAFLVGIAPPIIDAAVSNPPVTALASFALSIGNALFGVWMQAGLTIVMIKVARNQFTSFGEIFSGGPFIVTTILAGLVIGLAVAGALIVVIIPLGLISAAVATDPTTRGLVAVVGGVIVGVIVLGLIVRLSQATYVIVDQRAGAIESLKVSMRATSGKAFSLILIFLIAGLINVAGALALLIGLIFTIPLTFLILAVTYTALVDSSRKPSSDIATGWRKPEAMPDF